MLEINQNILNTLLSPVRVLNAKVEHYRDNTLLETYYKNTELQSVEIQRVAENSRFFGMIISHRLNVKLRDVDRVIDVSARDRLQVYLGSGNDFITYPTFIVSEVHRDENTNQLSITAYDELGRLQEEDTVSKLTLTTPYTLGEFTTAIASYLNTTYRVSNITDMFPFNLNYENGANFEGTETIKDALLNVAEATQTVIFLDYQNKLVLKRLSPDEQAVFTITRADYSTLTSKTNRRLIGVSSITELGDNVEAKLEQTGTIQQIHENPFWVLRDDIGDIVDNALAAVGGLTINQFSCSWFGNLFLEVGDKIGLVTKDNETVYSYILDDTITYNGALEEKSQWEYINDELSSTNSTSIGDILKQTYARVDKQQKEIVLHASNITNLTQEIGELKITANDISASVSSHQEAIDSITGELQAIRNSVSAQMTDEQIRIAIKEAVENTVNKVETETGFIFDKDGLTISKSDSEMSTIIDEDGMRVYKNNEEVLTANNQGVNAINLTARQYLIIGTHSRFEDYGYDRTGCFWIN